MPSPIPTAPLDEGEAELLKKFHADIARQSDHMDELAKQLITLELAIPGLYATALKLVSGDKAVLKTDVWLCGTLGFWFAALILSLIALFPRRYTVSTNLLQGEDPDTGAIGVKDYFTRSAAYKRRLVSVSCLLFFLGIIAALAAIA